jgi:hypothetical protein
MKNIEIIDNFFDNFKSIKESFKNIPLHEREEYKKRNMITDEDKKLLKDSNFPGKRSDPLHRAEPFLFNLTIKEIFDKINAKQFNEISLDCSVHLRTATDDTQDFIHKDPSRLGMLVYLSETNLKSGTGFYREDSDKPYLKIPFIQNSAVIFPGHIRHKSLLNYGNDINDGRLTLNGFIHQLN